MRTHILKIQHMSDIKPENMNNHSPTVRAMMQMCTGRFGSIRSLGNFARPGGNSKSTYILGYKQICLHNEVKSLNQ